MLKEMCYENVCNFHWDCYGFSYYHVFNFLKARACTNENILFSHPPLKFRDIGILSLEHRVAKNLAHQGYDFSPPLAAL